MQSTEAPTRRKPLNHDPDAVTWARNAKGWAQSQLASQVEISQSYMSEIEAGKKSAPPRLLMRIARALNCPVSMLERKREELL